MSQIFEVTKAATFDAAHHFPAGPADSPHRRVHGHSFQVEATVRGERGGEMGFVVDLTQLEAGLKAAAAELDHSLLNDHAGLEKPSRLVTPVRKYWCRYSLGSMTLPRPMRYIGCLPA